MNEIKWTASAISDLKEIHDYIKQENPTAATHIASQIYDSVKPLEHNPQIGRMGRIDGTRELVLGSLPYILMYELKAEFIFIKRVVHTSRLWPE